MSKQLIGSTQETFSTELLKDLDTLRSASLEVAPLSAEFQTVLDFLDEGVAVMDDTELFDKGQQAQMGLIAIDHTRRVMRAKYCGARLLVTPIGYAPAIDSYDHANIVFGKPRDPEMDDKPILMTHATPVESVLRDIFADGSFGLSTLPQLENHALLRPLAPFLTRSYRVYPFDEDGKPQVEVTLVDRLPLFQHILRQR